VCYLYLFLDAVHVPFLRLTQHTFLALWPLFHYLLWQDVATEYASADSHYTFYLDANVAFAQRLFEVYQPGDLIWVHDYHLLLVPGLVRKKLPEAVVGLFVHTPFPSSEVFRCLPSALISCAPAKRR
jgi:trehalose 6-phosphate synthase/phosphatase